ncbi:unnamed protein product [Cercopithifilaria johnstoni]|uniref:Uncharacterized protein n=1 Tax=Cercopithifilaria johnstoni TaxID=2874296 RepID=A0A8J2PSV5_9BILA|nr:unnamed protein product [Cercopithifilaria johnstoni]
MDFHPWSDKEAGDRIAQKRYGNAMVIYMVSLECATTEIKWTWRCASTNYRISRCIAFIMLLLNHQNSHRNLFMVDVGSKSANIQFATGVDSLDSGPSCSEASSISSSAPAVLVNLHKEPLSPVSERYRLKKFHLQEKYDYIYLSNSRLRNRLYHIKKEINHLKRLKRVLCQRLFTFRDPFMDSCLEIPDNDPASSTTEKISTDALGKPSGSSKKKKAADVKRVSQHQSNNPDCGEDQSVYGLLKIQGARLSKYPGMDPSLCTCWKVVPRENESEVSGVEKHSRSVLSITKCGAVSLGACLGFSYFKLGKLLCPKFYYQVNEVSSMVEIAKNSVISIIDSVITESHEERVRANQNSNGQKTSQQSPIVPALSESVRNEAGNEGVSEDGEPVIERMLHSSSVDHLLPVDPDSDPNNVLTGFGENLEENFMAQD